MCLTLKICFLVVFLCARPPVVFIDLIFFFRVFREFLCWGCSCFSQRLMKLYIPAVCSCGWVFFHCSHKKYTITRKTNATHLILWFFRGHQKLLGFALMANLKGNKTEKPQLNCISKSLISVYSQMVLTVNNFACFRQLGFLFSTKQRQATRARPEKYLRL